MIDLIERKFVSISFRPPSGSGLSPEPADESIGGH